MEERHGCRPGVTWCQESVSDNLCKKSYKEALFRPKRPTAQISILIHWMFLDVVTSLSEYLNMRLGQHEMAHRYLRRFCDHTKMGRNSVGDETILAKFEARHKRRPRRRAAGNISGKAEG